MAIEDSKRTNGFMHSLRKQLAWLYPVRRIWGHIGWLGIAVGILMWFLSTAFHSAHPEIFRYHFPKDAMWIGPVGEAQAGAVFRTDFDLPPKKIARGWMAISADNGFEAIVNSNPVGRWTLYRATRPYQSGHTEYGQRLRFQPTAIGLNFPREYQWGDNKNWQLVTFLDITKHLRAGRRNVMAITAQSRHPDPKFIMTGEIIFEDGTKIPLNSHTGWKGSYVPHGSNDREWTAPHFPIDHWPYARRMEPPMDSLWRIPPPGMFEHPFSQRWRPGPKTGPAIFKTKWYATGQQTAAWIRVLSLGPYLLRINGHTIRPRTGPGYNNSQGLWLAQPSNRRQMAIFPDKLDPDEVGGPHVGDNFLRPAHGDQSQHTFRPGESKLNLGKDSTSDPSRGDLLRRQYEDKPKQPNLTDAAAEELDTRVPFAVGRRHGDMNLVGFDVTEYLVPGENDVEIQLVEMHKAFNMPNARRISVEGGVIEDGQLSIQLGDNHPWTVNSKESLPTVRPHFGSLQNQFYRCVQPPEYEHYRAFIAGCLFTWIILTWMVIARHLAATSVIKAICPIWSAALVILLSVALKITLAERSEHLWFITNTLWRYFALAFAIMVAYTMTRFGYGKSARKPKKKVSRAEAKHKWRIALFAILFMGLIIRFYGVDDQPLDDDEYASVQTTLNIAMSGLPEIYKGIWYTRGPVYHYLAGGLIYFFGPHIWVMRAPAIFAGLIAAFFTYRIGSRVTKSQAIGVAAALIICLHPFCIFTSHVARFYQQQQTMTIATVYFFILGFIQASVPWKRALAFICFGIAVLSQEISLLVLVPCGICYGLMAKPESLRNEIRFAAICVMVMSLVVLNLLAFKVKCLTRLEGISPNIESTMSPHFSYPMNFLSLFIAYSRLHVLLSPFSIIGMVACLRRRATGMLAVTFFLLAGIFGTVLLVTGLGFRYQFSYLPLWVIAAVFGIRYVSDRITRGWSLRAQHFLSVIVILFGIVSFSPWRIITSYKIRILPDSSGAASYVRANMRPGDKIAITEPHPHCALLEAGRADYDICLPILYDFVYRSEEDGRLVDRNGGAESMGRIGTLQRAMAQHDRIWILLNREKIKNVSRNFRWEYAGARFDYFVRQNCQVMYHAYSWDVYLWDRGRGVLQSFRMEPEAWAE